MAELAWWTIAVSLLGALVLVPVIMGLFGGNKFDVKGKTVLLTGASEGLGKSVAKQLAAKGANVVIASRNIGKLEGALAEVKSAAATPSLQKFHYISTDLSEPDSAARLISDTIAWNNGVAPDIVWCIAGSSYPKLFIETSTTKLRQQMDINYWSCADMAHAILTEWLSPSSTTRGKPKHLIFTSSVAAFYPIAGYAPYSPSKAAIKALSDTLAQEVLLYGDEVKIHTVFPGGIRSPGFENENKTKPAITHILEKSDPVQEPDDVAKISISGLEKGEYLITVGLLGSAMRATAWGGSARNNWFIDAPMTWLTSFIMPIVANDLDGKVRAFGKKNGHPTLTRGKPEV